MSLEIIVPTEWKVFPSMTLQYELVRIIAKWQATHESTQGVTATFNGVTAKMVENGCHWWFRRVNDKTSFPNHCKYSIAVIHFYGSEAVRRYSELDSNELDLKSSSSSAPIEIRRQNEERFV